MHEENPGSARLAALGARIDFRECGPCAGACCRTPWTVYVSPTDIERLSRHTGSLPREFAQLAPLPEWELVAFGDGNLLFPRVTTASGRVPQLRKREDGACVFLDAVGACGVHAAKPLLCRLFPFYYAVTSDGAVPPRESASPLGSTRSLGRAEGSAPNGLSLVLLTDRGHDGCCPIGRERMREVESQAADALLDLMEAFETEVAEHARSKDAFEEAWRKDVEESPSLARGPASKGKRKRKRND